MDLRANRHREARRLANEKVEALRIAATPQEKERPCREARP
jgi:hypothetical protein